MDLETENRIAAILMKEAAELRRQAEKDGVHAYLRQPNVRGRPNSRFLTATVLGVQQANRAVEVNEMWRIRQKEQESGDRLQRRQRDESSSDRSYREQELADRLKRRQRDESSSDRSYREPELDDKLKRRRRDESSSDRSYRDTEDLWRSTNNSHADGERKTSDYCLLSKRIMQEYHLNEEEGLRDDEVENFLNSRVKRGRGAVGSRMDETGPYLPPCPDSKGNQLAIPDVAAREEWEHHANLRVEKASRLKSLNSFEDKHKKKKASSSKHNRKHRTKEKSKDKKRNRKEERRHKQHKSTRRYLPFRALDNRDNAHCGWRSEFVKWNIFY